MGTSQDLGRLVLEVLIEAKCDRAVDEACAVDRAWFKRHPNRGLYMRAPVPDELFTLGYRCRDDAIKRRVLLPKLCGSLDELASRLRAYNRKGYGIFVTVNETDGRGRKVRNIVRPRAVFQELDLPDKIPAEQGSLYWNMLNIVPVAPSKSSPGNRHNYYCLDGLTNQEWEAVQRRMVEDYMSDDNAKDLTRVLRVPGFFHCKDSPVMVRLLGGNGRWYSRDEILTAFPPLARAISAAPSIAGNMAFSPATEALVRSWITIIPGSVVEVRQAWLEHGWALARLGDEWADDERGDIRLELWEALSRKAEGFEDDTGCDEEWEKVCESAARPGRAKTFRSIQQEAEQAGWTWENSGIDPNLLDDAKTALREGEGGVDG